MKSITDLQLDELHASLSPIEIEIIQYICKGHSSAEIAKMLFKSARTIEGYRRSILEKTGVKNIASLVFYAIEHGIVSIKVANA